MALISKEQLEAAKKQNAAEQKKVRQKIVPRGLNILTLKDVSLELSQRSKEPMFVFAFRKSNDKNEDFKEMVERMVISENGLKTDFGVNLNLYYVLIFLKNAFGYEVDELDEDDPMGDLLKKIKAFVGKSFRGIVRHQKENTSNGGTFIKPALMWKYVGKIDDPTINKDTLPESALFKDATRKKDYTVHEEEKHSDAPEIPDTPVSDTPF